MPQVPMPIGIHSDFLALDPQHLDKGEVDEFLAYLFRDIARRPEAYKLVETAKVVRYLMLLSVRGVPHHVMQLDRAARAEYDRSSAHEANRIALYAVWEFADKLWGNFARYAKIKPCSEQVAKRFLRRHANTHFAGNPLFPRVLELVEGFEAAPFAPNELCPFQPPHLKSRSLTASGSSNPHVKDDLSDRIFAAFHALKRANVKRKAQIVADALTNAGVERKSKEGSGWTYETVNERIKEFQTRHRKRLLKLVGQGTLDAHVQKWRDQLVDTWIHRFRTSKKIHSAPGQHDVQPKAARPRKRKKAADAKPRGGTA